MPPKRGPSGGIASRRRWRNALGGVTLDQIPEQTGSTTATNREDVMPDRSDDTRHVSRRNLFKQVGMVEPAAAQTPAAPPRREALETLTAAEGETLEAIVARLIPSDESGPGAAEAC